MNPELQNKKGLIDGVEIYAKKFNLNGTVSSDTYAKIVTDEYKGVGKVVVESTPNTRQGGIKGITFEVGGDMLQDGIIKTDKDATVGVKVRGNYTSNKGKIIQGENLSQGWHTTWWGISIITVACGLITALFVFIFGLNK